MAELTLPSPCKINLLLNILGKRPDGFHDLETVFQPIRLCDELLFQRRDQGIALTCSSPALPVDSSNLVVRAATSFFAAAGIAGGVAIHLRKNIPLAAGLGGGSGNAAVTLLGLNRLFDQPLDSRQLHELAAQLGSDVPFFLQEKPALGIGRGENIQPIDPFAILTGMWVLLLHPGFGVSTAWAYRHLADFPDALHGRPGRAQQLIDALRQPDWTRSRPLFHNSLEAPVFDKYPILRLYQEFMLDEGAQVSLMSGSGSTTFALIDSPDRAQDMAAKIKDRFGAHCWTAAVAM